MTEKGLAPGNAGPGPMQEWTAEEARLQQQGFSYILGPSLAGQWDCLVQDGSNYLSTTFRRMFEYEEQDLPNQPETWQRLIFPEDFPGLLEALDKHISSRGAAPFHKEARWHHKNGSTVWVMSIGRVLEWDAAGQPARMIGCHMDITARKQGEAVMTSRLRLQQFAGSHSLTEFLRATLDEAEALTGSQSGFYHFVEPDQVTLSLQAWSTNTTRGMCSAEGAGRHYPVNQAGVWADCIRERRPLIHNDYASHPHRKGLPEGHTPIIRELVVPVMRGNAIVAVLGVGNKPADYCERDIESVSSLADLAWDMAEVKRKDEALQNRESRFRQLFEADILPIAYWNMDGTFTDANGAWCRLTGLDPAQVRAGKASWHVITPPEMLARDLTAIREIQAKGACVPYEKEFIRTDGSRVPVLITGSMLTGSATEGIAFAMDLTERKQAEAEREKLEAQNRQLQKSESLSRMAGAIAHHFNNQLQAVMLSLELAMNGLPRDSEAAEILAGAMLSARKGAEVSSLMLTYLGQTAGAFEALDLSETCLRSLVLLRAIIPKSVILRTGFPTPGPVIHANAKQIQQVLTNLVTNAWEAGSAQDAICITIKTVSAGGIPVLHRFPLDCQPQDDTYACLEVADTGSGIPGKHIEELFDPFFSTKFTGRGLGLAVVLGVVRAHRGAVTVESTPGCGSTFRVFLPLSSETDQTRRIPEVIIGKAHGRGAVLLVDDEPEVRTPVTRALKRMGFDVLAAEDGVEGMQLFREHQKAIRVVLCDLTMPRMNGWETLAALRKLAPGVPVILASGHSETTAMEGEHPQLPDAFLKKPYHLKELGDAIARVMGNRAEPGQSPPGG